jgi:hypothetical protein
MKGESHGWSEAISPGAPFFNDLQASKEGCCPIDIILSHRISNYPRHFMVNGWNILSEREMLANDRFILETAVKYHIG